MFDPIAQKGVKNRDRPDISKAFAPAKSTDVAETVSRMVME
jgi:hypothetical protein